MAKKEQSTPVIVNRKAQHLYFVDETFEVGIMLIGSEVKSIRDGKCTLGEAWIDIDEKNWYVKAAFSLCAACAAASIQSGCRLFPFPKTRLPNAFGYVKTSLWNYMNL